MAGLSPINKALARIPKRAEVNAIERLRETFVDSGVSDVLEVPDHQVLYGRRGTGKTHAFRYLQTVVESEGDVAAYVDLRTIGSVEGVFGAAAVDVTERTARLLVDLLNVVHDQILGAALEDDRLVGDELLVRRLDGLLESISTVAIVGEVEVSESSGARKTATDSNAAGIKLDAAVGEVALSSSSASSTEVDAGHFSARRGHQRVAINFSDVARALRELAESLSAKRVWILLDEWTGVPRDVQPFLAAFLVRCLLPLSQFSVKIAAIEQHANFRTKLENGQVIGLEIGADLSANLDLDQFMVFEQDEEKARAFFAGLFIKHLTAVQEDEMPHLGDPADLVRAGFTDVRALDELIRAAEGVPRDAINIAGKAAMRAGESKISVENVRSAAKTWFQSDKEAALQTQPEAMSLLRWVVDNVIKEKRSRSFLVNQKESRLPLLMTLFDARVVHLSRRGYSAQDEPGERYDVFSIDYGAYVDLINTKFAPRGNLAGSEDGGWVDVPTEDLRAIRRAILHFADFEGG